LLYFREHFKEAIKFARRSVSDQDIRCSLRLSRLHLRSHLLGLAYKLQQSRGFQVGNNFKFPEVEGGPGGHEAATVTGNAGFSDDTGAYGDRARLNELFSFCHTQSPLPKNLPAMNGVHCAC
jgi:hypothetical protein